MKLWRPMLAMLLCSGLIIAFGLTACGSNDDDEEETGMTCGQAYDQLTSTDCTTQAFDNVDSLKACIAAATTEGEVDLCLDAFQAAIPDCLPGVNILFDRCGQCQRDCGNAFAGDDGIEGCLSGPQTGTECLTELLACVNAC